MRHDIHQQQVMRHTPLAGGAHLYLSTHKSRLQVWRCTVDVAAVAACIADTPACLAFLQRRSPALHPTVNLRALSIAIVKVRGCLSACCCPRHLCWLMPERVWLPLVCPSPAGPPTRPLPLPAECPDSQAAPAACTGSLRRPLWRLGDSCGPAAAPARPERDAAARS